MTLNGQPGRTGSGKKICQLTLNGHPAGEIFRQMTLNRQANFVVLNKYIVPGPIQHELSSMKSTERILFHQISNFSDLGRIFSVKRTG